MNWDDFRARSDEYAERCHSDWIGEETAEEEDDD
jgi:hypothetical protein